MSIAAVEYARTVTGLKITEKFVLTTIGHYLNSKSNLAWPSIPTLAADCSMSERTVCRALAGLEAKNLIKRLHSQTNQRNIYQLPGFEAASTHDSVSPPDNVTPCQVVTPTPVRNDRTPDRNDTPNKEDRELIHREREREGKASLSFPRKPTVHPQAPQAIPQVIPQASPLAPVFNWNEYIREAASRRKLSRVEERAIVNDLVMEEDFRQARMQPKRDTLAEARACYGL